MFDWKYWRWTIVQKLPVATLTALLVAVFGWVAIDAIPVNHTATARIVLERTVGLTGASKAQRTSEEVQHLQVVIHTLKSDPTFGQSDQMSSSLPKLAIETSRDKPSYLSIEAMAQSSTDAIETAQFIVAQTLKLSEAMQAELADETLGKFRADHALAGQNLDQMRANLSAHLNSSPTVKTETLREQATRLRAQLHAAASVVPVEDPALKKLHADLASAKGLYSDLHPKVRLIHAQIDRAEVRIIAPGKAQQVDLQQRLEAVEKMLLLNASFHQTTQKLERDVASLTAAKQRSEEALTVARHISDSSYIRLRVIQDASTGTRNPDRMRELMHIALILVAITAGLSTIALKIRFDHTLRRPDDLQRSLGLTPFATLPDLGPSLG